MRLLSNFKNKSLAFQIWSAFSAVIVIYLVVIMGLVIYGFYNFSSYASFQTIENAQGKIIERIASNKNTAKEPKILLESKDKNINFKHIICPDTYTNVTKNVLGEEKFSQELWSKALSQYEKQTTDSKRYKYEGDGTIIFYVITKYSSSDGKGFVLSYIESFYNREVLKQITIKFIMIIACASFLILLTAMKIASHLSKPIRRLKNNVEKIALREWDMPVNLDRKDEIGELSKSIENMRLELKKRDDDQQWMLQNISHELKTPVMVIRSYAQSVEDGFFPKGTLSDTMKVIDGEAQRLEKKIRNLLYLTKLEYLSKNKKVEEVIDIKELIEDIVERFKVRKAGVEWNISLDHIIFLGDGEQWRVAIENILDNSLRYCKNEINISIKEKDDSILIRIFNDGELIEEALLGEVFNQFSKGEKGKFGLGLAIAKQVVNSHSGTIWVENEDSGVSFFIKIKKDKRMVL